MTKQQDRLAEWLFVLILFAFPICLSIFGNTVLQFITVTLGVVILALMWRLHRVNVKEDKARGIYKGINRVGSIQLSGGLLCLIGIYLIVTRWGSFSVTAPLDWAWVLFSSFFIIRGVICYRAGVEYSKTIDRLEEYETQLERLGCELDELGELERKAHD